MDLREMKVKKSVEIELGEEKLHQVYDLGNVNKTMDLIVGVDGGSTQTRVVVLEAGELDVNTQYIIPSNNVLLPDDRELKPKSEELIDRLDSFIVNKTTVKEGMIGRDRVVRATKMNDTGLSPASISSSVQKINEPIFYINIIDSIGYALMQKYKNEIPAEVNIVAGIALPPDDMSSTKNMDIFRKNIIGTYEWSHTDSRVKIKINILDITLATEPEAFVKAYYVSTEQEIPETVLCINTGGRSTGVAALIEGKTLDSASQTFEYGGNQFLSEVGKFYNNTHGGRVPTQKALAKAVKTGKLKSGNSTIDVVSDITEACKVFGTRIFNDTVKKVCDYAAITLDSINEVIMCGGLARGGEYEVSPADYVGELFEEKTPDTEFTIVEENLIPFGLAFLAFIENEDFLLGENEEEEVEEEETVDAEVVYDMTNVEE